MGKIFLSKKKGVVAALITGAIFYSGINYADDTEVYFNSDNKALKPNLLFLLDLSSSMGSFPINTGISGMSQLKSALEEILTDRNLSGLRIGTMTFSSKVNLIDEVTDIDEIDTSKDVVKTPSTAGYTKLAQKVFFLRDNGSGSTDIITGTADIMRGLTVFPTAAKPYDTLLTAAQSIGFRFNNILIKNPSQQGITPAAGINKATFSFTTYGSSTSGTITLYVDPAAQSKYLRDDVPRDLQNRIAGTSSVTCTVPAGTFQRVNCDVTSLVRRQVALTDWHAGNAITFIAKRNSTTIGMAFNTAASSTYHPTLEIEAANQLIANNEKTVATRILENSLALPIEDDTRTVFAMVEASKYISSIRGNSGVGPYHGSPYSSKPSPITDSCQLTHLVLMSDGAPSGAGDAAIAAPYMGQTASACQIFTADDKSTSKPDNVMTVAGEGCGRAFASWLARTSHSDDKDSANVVRTHTIGLNVFLPFAKNFLADVATAGMGKSYNADNAKDLASAFQDVIDSALITSRPSAGGSVALGAESKYAQRTEAFYGLYQTSPYDYWLGNVKGFKLDYVDYQLPESGEMVKRPVLRDWSATNAVVSTEGEFIANYSTAWSNNDSGDIASGGVVGQLAAPAARKMFTLKSSTGSITNGIPLISGSAGITTADLGVAGGQDARRKGLLDFIRGYSYVEGGNSNSTNVRSPKIGESANNGITLINYGCSEPSKNSLTCDFNNLDLVGLSASNDGFFRGYNLRNGKALYEFMPQQMLPVINKLQTAQGLNKDIVKTYGLDGGVVISHDDPKNNGIISAGEKAYAIVKSGRGGPYLYGFDVSTANKNDPKLVWTIEPTGAFRNMGDTWSLPVAGKMNIAGKPTQVLVMGGGYDTSNDSRADQHANTKGNAIYVIDAATGALLWSTSDYMNYSVPGQVAVLNDKEGFITDVVFGDMGGQIWHFKVNNGVTRESLLKPAGGDHGIVASFSGRSAEETRRFYQTPMLYKIDDTTVSVNIGSGNKAHPLITNNNDRFYSFRLPLSGDNPNVLVERNLDVADPMSTKAILNPSPNGFMVKLGSIGNAKGEKVISNAFADQGRLIFSTFIPSTGVTREKCVINTVGTQRTYFFNLLTGASMLKSGYTEVLPATLPLDPVVYCGAADCTVISSMDMLAEDSNIVDASIFKKPQAKSGKIVKRGWTDLFNPLEEL